MGEEVLPEALLERFRASQDRQSRAMVLYRPPTNLVDEMRSGGGLQTASEDKASEDKATDIVSSSSDENSNSGSSDASRRGSTKDSSDVDMS